MQRTVSDSVANASGDQFFAAGVNHILKLPLNSHSYFIGCSTRFVLVNRCPKAIFAGQKFNLL